MLIDDILPQLLIDAPECPDPVAARALIQSAGEFCRDTMVWNIFPDPVPLVDEQAVYTIVVPAGSRAVAVMAAWVNGRELKPKTLAEISRTLPGWQTATGSEPVLFNSQQGEDSVRVFPIPLQAAGAPLLMRVAVEPTDAATELPDTLMAPYGEAVIQGALARLMLQPRKPWSNPDLGAFNGTRFASAKTEARIKVLHDGAPGSLRVAPRTFGF